MSARSQIVVSPELAYTPLFGLHPGLRRCGGTGNHVVLVPWGTGRSDAPARTPASPATTTSAATRRRWFLLIWPVKSTVTKEEGPLSPPHQKKKKKKGTCLPNPTLNRSHSSIFLATKLSRMAGKESRCRRIFFFPERLYFLFFSPIWLNYRTEKKRFLINDINI